MAVAATYPIFPERVLRSIADHFKDVAAFVAHEFQTAANTTESALDHMLAAQLKWSGPIKAPGNLGWRMAIDYNYIGGGNATRIERGDIALIVELNAPGMEPWQKILLLQSKRLNPKKDPLGRWHWDVSCLYDKLKTRSLQSQNILVDPLPIAYLLQNPCHVPVVEGSCNYRHVNCSAPVGFRVIPGKSLLRSLIQRGNARPRFSDVQAVLGGGYDLGETVRSVLSCRIGRTIRRPEDIVPFREGRVTRRVVDVRMVSERPVEMRFAAESTD